MGGEYSLFSRAANEDVPTQAQAQKMAKQMQEYIAIQQQSQAEAERQAQAQERMRQAAEAAGEVLENWMPKIDEQEVQLRELLAGYKQKRQEYLR